MFTRPFAALPKTPAPAEDFAGDVEYYLGLDPCQLPSRYLYDPLGSALFDAIGELPWYGITRAEIGLLEQHGHEILAHAGWPSALSRVVELGPGNGTKLLTLLRAGHDGPAEHRLDLHLIDVSAKALDGASHALASLDGVRIVRHEATYEKGLGEVAGEPHAGARTMVLFLGSNIGNFDRPGAEEFLRAIRAALEPGDGLLVGADLVKPVAELLLAYDDPLGVTAAFNLNLLVRINRELGGDFDLQAFGHRALWNRDASRVEMHLVSRRRQRVRVAAAHVDMEMDEGDTIWTESSYKYELDELATLLERTGFRPIDRWLAGRARFALTLAAAV
jgi:dimethylhistidine N-methyltransferase